MGNQSNRRWGRTAVAVLLLAALLLASLTVVRGSYRQQGDGQQAYLPFVAREPTPTPTPTPTPSGYFPPDDLEVEGAIVEAINQQRSANGLAPFNLVEELTYAARRHSHDMAKNHFTGHIGSDGSTGGERMQDAGYDWIAWAEIVGWGFGGDPELMMNWWLNSPIHRDMILHTYLIDMGVGYCEDADSDWGHYWTVDFGRRVALEQGESGGTSVCVYLLEGEMGGVALSFSPAGDCPPR